MSYTDGATDLPMVSGYDTADRFFATQYRQGGRVVFDIDLSLTQVASYLPEPDPDHPEEGNRKIRLAHAESFGNYIVEKEDWVAPALLLRAPEGMLTFEPVKEVGGVQWGLLAVPKLSRTDLHIIDGQHRIFGIHYAHKRIAADMDRARRHLAKAKAAGAEPAVLTTGQANIRRLERVRERLGAERISVQIIIIDDPISYQQVFVDIADHALGITNAVKTRMDARKIVNRTLSDVCEHPLLRGHVDFEQDRVLGSNPHLLSAKHVADIVRTVEVGLNGRITARLEDELREADLVDHTSEFLDTMVHSFPDLAKVADDSLPVMDLRKRSLLGSTTILRVLAGVYHELLRSTDHTPSEVGAYFAKLSPYMSAPVQAGSLWDTTELFGENAMAPTSRRQDLMTLQGLMVKWMADGLPEGVQP